MSSDAGSGGGDARGGPPRLAVRAARVADGALTRWRALRGRPAERADLRVVCPQCDRVDGVTVLRLRSRAAADGRRIGRTACRTCGAVWTGPLTPAADVRPLVEVAPQPVTDPVADLTPYLAPPLARWAVARARRPLTPASLDRATMTQLHKWWDAQTARARDGDEAALAQLAGAGLAEPPPALPAFPTIVGALHDRCYRGDAVAAALAGPQPAPPELIERVAGARRWLAARGRDLCWIESRRAAEPCDPAHATAAADALEHGRDLTPEAARAARTAAYGVDGGPGLRMLLATHDAAATAAAVRAHLADGSHPLRDRVLADLDAP